MPRRAPKVCSMPGCIEDAVVKSGRCPEHGPKPWASGGGASRRDPAELKRFRALRPKVFRRDRGECVFCGGQASQIDHRLPDAWGGRATMENLQSMCAADHEVKRKEEAALGGRLSRGQADESDIARHVQRWTPFGVG